MSEVARARQRVLRVTNPNLDDSDSDDLGDADLDVDHDPDDGHNDAHDVPFAHDSSSPSSRKGKLIQTLKSPFYRSHHRAPPDAPPKRPRTVRNLHCPDTLVSAHLAQSPTLPAADAHNSFSSASPGSGKVLIVVTTDSDWYVTVDISGAPNAAYVRECIFNKLNIQDDDQLRFSIYLTEMGAYAIGDALTDQQLYTLCATNGDNKGSLKFFVSHSSAPVHEQPPPRNHSPTATTIPPPVLPFNAMPTPLRATRAPRQESVSSDPHETNGGYEADLDNPDRDTYKPSPHPLPSPPQQHHSTNSSSNPPSSPRQSRRPNCQLGRSHSPRTAHTPPPPAENFRHDLEQKQYAALPPPPPLSPNRSTFVPGESSLSPPAHRHGRSGSDAAAEREQPLRSADHQSENAGRQWRSPQQHAFGGRLRTEPLKEALSPQKEPRRKRYPNNIEEVGRSDSWVVDQEISPPLREARTQIPTPRSSAPRPLERGRYNKITHPYTGRPLALPNPPRQPPPVPMASSNEVQASAQRPAGVPIPSIYFAWKGEDRKEQKAMPSSASQWSRLTKGTKSMDNLRAAALNHPATLQPGGARRVAPQLPMTRQAPPVPSYPSSYSPGGPKYDAPRPPVRPLPVQGTLRGANNSNIDLGRDRDRDTYTSPRAGVSGTGVSYPYGTLVSPNQDPYPRPRSAFGDSISPTRRTQRLQSPTFGSLDSGEAGRSPRGISPGRPGYHSAHHSASSKLENHYGSRSDRSSDAQSGAETSYTTPPRTPISPRSPLYPGRDREREREKGSGSSRPSTSDSKLNNGTWESTLKPDQQVMFSTLLSQNADGTVLALRGAPEQQQQHETVSRLESPVPPSSATSEMSESTFLNQYEQEEDSGGDDLGTAIWKKRPTAEAERPKSILRPPLKLDTASTALKEENKAGTTTTQPQVSQHATFVSPPPQPQPHRSITPPKLQRRVKGERGLRGSTFTNRQSSTWAPRPPPEDVYERLEEFFPEHDLDKPVIEANSGGTSPTTAEPPAVLAPPVAAPPEKVRIRGKKSIRIVAEEHKKLIDRTSRANPTTSYSNIIRKRSTKLWGSKLEEVTTAQAKMAAGVQAAPESPSGGATFKWVRGELIGRGTYGRVYLALNATTGEMIAVKQVETPRTASDKNDSRQVTVVQALKMESETLKDLDHPNIVQYLGFEETPDNLSIFLEYVPGGSIGSCLLKHGKFDENVTKSFTSQILAGLEYLHSKGILHRDLKADNILVEMSGVCKISDFGISKRTDDASGGAFTAMQGTVFWMAPEVINTQKKGYNFKIDIWSVGCVVLEMWAGMRPWMGDEAVAVMFKVRFIHARPSIRPSGTKVRFQLYQSKLPPPVPEDVVLSELADDFRRKCFAINPEERPTAAELRKHPYLVLPPDWVFTDF
ncbi:hypothetical protein DXG03_008997 [Asterophora parasitica]|uniref:Protein kinase domain-containing protein n=1 Tax=Asterophora parasitica TaxID=117018 RepID=A0A9P7GDL2_9AGAR|nr:hypothetical protein DXG03_008997 [Asterophora parasitica]